MLPRIKLVFAVFGDTFVPNSLTHLINITPTDSWNIGEEIANRKAGLFRKETGWQYDFGFKDTLCLENITDIFVKTFKHSVEHLNEFTKAYSLSTKVYIVVEMNAEEKPALYFNKEFVGMLSQLNSEVDLDLYVL